MRLVRLVLVLAILACVVLACGAKKGGLMLAITTDMKAPKDVSAIGITIVTNDRIKHNVVARVTPDGIVSLPATLAVAEGDDRNTTVRIRVIAFQERRARVLRDVRTSFPSGGRVALLRLPLNFASDGMALGELPSDVLPAGRGGAGGDEPPDGAPYDASLFRSVCPDASHTVVDGECVDAYVDPSTLPDFEEQLWIEQTSCFDAATCFADARIVDDAALDLDACRVTLPGGTPAQLAFALVTSSAGECLRPDECYVPLDVDAPGFAAEVSAHRLPAYVCKLLRAKKARLAMASHCAAKNSAQPVCETSSSPTTPDGGSAGDSSVVADGAAADSGAPDALPSDGAVSDASRADGGAEAGPVGPASFIALDVDGRQLKIDCTHLDRDFTAPGALDQDPWLGGTSASTGLTFLVRIANSLTPYENGSIPGDYPLLNGGNVVKDANDPRYALKLKYPVGSARYITQSEGPTATEYHRVRVALVGSTATTASYRISAEFTGNFLRLDAAGTTPVRGTGSWSLLVTYPKR